MGQPGRKWQELRLADCMQVMLTMMLVLLAGMLECTAFRAYDCYNQSAQIEQYWLLDPEPCGNMDKVHTIEQELLREIVQNKKELLVQVTRCTASQTVKSAYCGFQSRSGVERYDYFHERIVIEPTDCLLAAKTGRFKINGKDYPFKMNVRRLVVVKLDLDNNGNCKVGLYKVNGVPLRSQVVTAMYEIYVHHEWARANYLTGYIKLSEYLMGMTTDPTLVDSGEGTYIWNYSQDACPDMLVSLYRGRIKVLTNSMAIFTDSTAIVSERDKNQVAELKLKETMILCGRAAKTTHIKNIAVFSTLLSR
jgi:hypothetical protein